MNKRMTDRGEMAACLATVCPPLMTQLKAVDQVQQATLDFVQWCLAGAFWWTGDVVAHFADDGVACGKDSVALSAMHQVPGALMEALASPDLLDPVVQALYGQLMTSSVREEAAAAALVRYSKKMVQFC